MMTQASTTEIKRYGCFNRPPIKDTLEVQDGWNLDGTRTMITIKNAMSKSCKFDLKLTQPECQSCRWQTEVDPRDIK